MSKHRNGRQIRLAYTKFSILIGGIIPEYADFLEVCSTDNKYVLSVRLVNKELCKYNYVSGMTHFYDGSTYKPSKWTLTDPNGWKRAMSFNQALWQKLKRF